MSSTQSSSTALLRAFEKIFVINLPERTDRRQDIEKQLNSIGLGLDHPDVCLISAVKPQRKLGFPSIGARGCFLSHVSVLEKAISMSLNRFLVLEDDVDFSADFPRRIGPLSKCMQQMDWDMFYGYMPGDVPRADFKQEVHLALVSPETEVECLHFFGCSGRAAVKALPYLKAILNRPAGDARGGVMHVDGAYSWFRRSHQELVTLSVNPPLAVQRPSRSDIHDLQWFDRNETFRPIANWARRLKRPVG